MRKFFLSLSFGLCLIFSAVSQSSLVDHNADEVGFRYSRYSSSNTLGLMYSRSFDGKFDAGVSISRQFTSPSFSNYSLGAYGDYFFVKQNDDVPISVSGGLGITYNKFSGFNSTTISPNVTGYHKIELDNFVVQPFVNLTYSSTSSSGISSGSTMFGIGANFAFPGNNGGLFVAAPNLFFGGSTTRIGLDLSYIFPPKDTGHEITEKPNMEPDQNQMPSEQNEDLQIDSDEEKIPNEQAVPEVSKEEDVHELNTETPDNQIDMNQMKEQTTDNDPDISGEDLSNEEDTEEKETVDEKVADMESDESKTQPAVSDDLNIPSKGEVQNEEEKIDAPEEHDAGKEVPEGINTADKPAPIVVEESKPEETSSPLALLEEKGNFFVQIAALSKSTDDLSSFKEALYVGSVYRFQTFDWTKIRVGKYRDYQEANAAKELLISHGFAGAFIVEDAEQDGYEVVEFE